MNAETALQRLAYALLGISPLLSIDELAGVTWEDDDGRLAINLELAAGPRITVNVGLESSGASLANVVMTAFDLLQQELAETTPFRSQARPACRPGHAHPATCEELDNVVALVCPQDHQVLRPICAVPPE